LKIQVKLSREKKTKTIDINSSYTIEDLLKKLQIKPDTVLVLNNKKPIPITEDIKKDFNLTLIQVSSGG